MEKVKADLRGLSADDKGIKARVVYGHMNGNPAFPNPEPSMPELLDAITELGDAMSAALDRGRMACARKRFAVARIDRYMSRLAAYVNSMAEGDVTKLHSSGFPLAKKPEPWSELPQPVGLRNTRSPYPGRVDLRWKSIRGAKVYEVESCTGLHADGSKCWERLALTTKPKLMVKDLQPYSNQIFRVRAVGTKTVSPYSMEFLTKAA